MEMKAKNFFKIYDALSQGRKEEIEKKYKINGYCKIPTENNQCPHPKMYEKVGGCWNCKNCEIKIEKREVNK